VFGVVALLQLNEVPGTHDLALNVFGVAVLSVAVDTVRVE